MLRGGSTVQFCIDVIVVTSFLPKYVNNRIRVDAEHCSMKYSNNIFLEKGNNVKMLDIKETLYIDDKNPDYSATISIYAGRRKIYEKIFDLSQNMIGTISYDVSFSFCLVFRIINTQVNETVIYNVPKFKLSDFEVAETLGSGASGVAYKVIDNHGQPHVLKVPNRKIDISNPNSNELREIVSLIALPRHPCIIRLDGFICNHNHGIILVLEYASRGRIDKIDFKSLEESHAFKILYGLFSCVAFIHHHGFIHRDLHPSNILVTEDYEARLIDFDVSRFYGDDLTHNVGHEGYMAPKMMGNGDYDESVDEFSLSVLISDILDKSSPFYILRFLLNNKYYPSKITCSEACTLLECEYLIDVSAEMELYITELSRYYESDEFYYYSLVIMIDFTDIISNKNAYCNIFKLIDCLDNQKARDLFSLLVLFDENIALDTDYIYCTNELTQIPMIRTNKILINISIDKINYIYYDLLNRYDIEVVSIYFFIIFWAYDWSIYFLKSIPNDRLKNIFDYIYDTMETDQILIFLESLYRKACKFDAIYLMNLFSMIAEHKTSKSINKKLYKYMIEIGDRNAKKNCYNILINLYLCEDQPDYEKAKYYAKIGLKEGNSECALWLTRIYSNKKKLKKAIEYLKISAKLENSEAMFYLGVFYISGTHIHKNIEKGIKYLKRSVNKGYAAAQNALANFYFAGTFVPRDFHQAFWYNSFAVNQGYKEALFLQAILYFNGCAVEQDFVKARIFFEQCIDSTNRDAAIEMLAYIHLYGLGVDISIEKADYYLDLLVDEWGRRKYYPIIMDESYIRSNREEMIHNLCYEWRNMKLF